MDVKHVPTSDLNLPAEPTYPGPYMPTGHQTAQELIQSYNAATDAEAANYALGTLGNHAIGQALRQARYYLASMAQVNFKLSTLDLNVLVESEEGIAALQMLAGLLKDIPKEAEALGKTVADLYYRGEWQVSAIEATLAQRQREVEAELLRQQQEEEEAAQRQREAEAAEQKELSWLQEKLQKLGFRLPVEERTKS